MECSDTVDTKGIVKIIKQFKEAQTKLDMYMPVIKYIRNGRYYPKFNSATLRLSSEV